jgi:hypothetical protein
MSSPNPSYKLTDTVVIFYDLGFREHELCTDAVHVKSSAFRPSSGIVHVSLCNFMTTCVYCICEVYLCSLGYAFCLWPVKK